ncbi:MAG: alpha/beta hydrolase, partial [Alphaproteobacteria bacterium]|nr:alpha/beta hydrolase [Alphaproteobacteria bacterium]
MSAPFRKSLPVEEGDVSFLEWKGARPGLHFAHANGFNAQTYQSLLSPLAEDFRILASDMRGHGFTTLPARAGKNRWTVYGHDLESFLDAVHPAPLVLAGHSMGAIASLMLAAKRPERVRALVLAEPVLVPPLAHVKMRLARLAGLRPAAPDLAERAARRRELFPSREEAFAAWRGRGAF